MVLSIATSVSSAHAQFPQLTQHTIPYFFSLSQILVHLGLLTKESGFKIAENAFSGGPLGELVQWSDLITTLYLLGHDVRISASIAELKESVLNTLGDITVIHLSCAEWRVLAIELNQKQYLIQTCYIESKFERYIVLYSHRIRHQGGVEIAYIEKSERQLLHSKHCLYTFALLVETFSFFTVF